ncbi:nuclear transport factor 2 family protein [Pseudomonas putida]
MPFVPATPSRPLRKHALTSAMLLYVWCLPALAAPTDDWALVNRYLDAWNRHEPAAIAPLTGPGFTYFNTSAKAPSQGPQRVEEIMVRLTEKLPDLHWQVVGSPVISQAGIAFQWRVTGTTHLATGDRAVDLPGASFAQVRQGQLVYFADYYNAQDMRQQLAP